MGYVEAEKVGDREGQKEREVDWEHKGIEREREGRGRERERKKCGGVSSNPLI